MCYISGKNRRNIILYYRTLYKSILKKNKFCDDLNTKDIQKLFLCKKILLGEILNDAWIIFNSNSFSYDPFKEFQELNITKIEQYISNCNRDFKLKAIKSSYDTYLESNKIKKVNFREFFHKDKIII